MKFCEYLYRDLTPLNNLIKLTEQDDILFFDIETTGLSRRNNFIYLIGCGYYSDAGLNIIQWFAENENEEIAILKCFLDFSSSFSCLVNYNGKSFDIPFTKERLNRYNLSMPDLKSIDIYTYVKPLKKLLSLNDLTQKTIESFLKVKRFDTFNGGELISVYKKWVNNNLKNSDIAAQEERLNWLLLHNKEDVLNMHYLTDILDYCELFTSPVIFQCEKINEYTDFEGNTKQELLLYGFNNDIALPNGFKSFYNNETGSYIMNVSSDGSISIRVPIIVTTLNYYLNNYKDYYYLPYEDICILKSMAGGVSKENRVNATKETCHIKCTDSYIPISCEGITIREFKDCYKSKKHYIRLSDFLELPNEDKNIIFSLYFKSFC